MSTDGKTNPPKKSDNSVIYNEVFMMPILAGVLIPITIFCMLCFIYRKGKVVDFGYFISMTLILILNKVFAINMINGLGFQI